MGTELLETQCETALRMLVVGGGPVLAAIAGGGLLLELLGVLVPVQDSGVRFAIRVLALSLVATYAFGVLRDPLVQLVRIGFGAS